MSKELIPLLRLNNHLTDLTKLAVETLHPADCDFFIQFYFFKTLFRYFPVKDFSFRATSSGVPFATIFPPLCPPSGPMSIM
jgi:hypothetical protein